MGPGQLVALQGIHAMLAPGVYPLQLDAQLPDGTTQSFQQSLVISDAAFPKESLTVPAESIDPAVTGPEEQFVLTVVAASLGNQTLERASGPSRLRSPSA